MADLASVDDLEILMKRTFSGADLDQAEMVLSSVSAWARSVSGQAWSVSSDVPSDVKYVVLAAARRSLRNPDGVTAESMGPFSKSYDRPPTDFFTPAELAILKRYRPKASRGLTTIGFTRGEEANPKIMRHYLLFDGVGDPLPYWADGDPGFAEEYDFLD